MTLLPWFAAHPRALPALSLALRVVTIAGIVMMLASSCHHVDDGRSAVCLGVTATHGLCVEWAPRP